jgi:hypothetical protein
MKRLHRLEFIGKKGKIYVIILSNLGNQESEISFQELSKGD